MDYLAKNFLIILISLFTRSITGDINSDFPNYTSNPDSFIIQNNKINVIPKDYFQYVTNLKYLDLGNNEIKKFENGTFIHLKQLTFMNISNNEIAELSVNIFDELSSLKCLNLSNNKLTTLPRDIFSKNNDLEAINLSGNQFQTLPEGLFENRKNLKFLRIRNIQQLTYLPNGFFSNLPNLLTVSMSSCNLKTLPENLFNGSINLKNIRIRNNTLESLPEKIFDGLINLKTLQLAENQIKSLPDNIFHSCKNLLKLNLNNNNILTISGFAFNGLGSLNELYMQYNKIIMIDKSVFIPLKIVAFINLSHNNITHFTKSETKKGNKYTKNYWRNLKHIDLSYNKISNLQKNWIKIPQIRHLNLSNNLLSSLTTDDLNLRHDHDYILDLSHNNITRINFNNCETHFPEEHGRKITLLLNDNPLACDSALYDLLRYLDGTITKKVRQKLFIEIGPMKCSNSKEYGGKLLSEINSEDYKIIPSREDIVNYDSCPKGCDLQKKSANKMFLIDCSFRNLTEIPKTLCYSRDESDYNELNLTGNFITDVSTVHSNDFNKLRILDLSHNRISTIPEIILIENKYKLLKLNDNQLTTLSKEIKKLIYLSVDKIHLGNNPWECNCQTSYLLELIHQNVVGDENNLNCLESNSRIMDLSFYELCPIEIQVFITLVGTGIGIIGLLIGGAIIFYRRSRKKIKNWLYTRNPCLFLTEEELDKDKIYDAFISYSHKDEEFVINELIKNLEMEPQSYKICIHFRDWLAGEWIPTQITRSIQESRRTIVVVSTNFIESEWGRVEFRAAYKEGMDEGIARVIVVLYGDIGPIDNLEPYLKSYLKMNTYIKWGDPWFWDKLRYSLPNKSHVPSKNLNSNRPDPVAQLEFRKIERRTFSENATIPLEELEIKTLEN